MINKLSSDLSILLHTSQYGDVKFIVGPTNFEFIGHRVILSVRSEYFKSLFKYHTTLIIELPLIDEKIFISIINFIYTAKFSPANILLCLEIYKQAHEWLICDLEQLCIEYIYKNIQPETCNIIEQNASEYVKIINCCRAWRLQYTNRIIKEETIKYCQKNAMSLLDYTSKIYNNKNIFGYMHDNMKEVLENIRQRLNFDVKKYEEIEEKIKNYALTKEKDAFCTSMFYNGDYDRFTSDQIKNIISHIQGPETIKWYYAIKWIESSPFRTQKEIQDVLGMIKFSKIIEDNNNAIYNIYLSKYININNIFQSYIPGKWIYFIIPNVENVKELSSCTFVWNNIRWQICLKIRDSMYLLYLYIFIPFIKYLLNIY